MQTFNSNSRVAQRKRAGPITQRSVNQNYALLPDILSMDGSVVECSPAMRAAWVRLSVDAFYVEY
ncbi:hypothetical protein OUZ56_009975 [Daphnia magna]|uniref:Uncharacterized protein n=1 Tax=Daphnia magna TaxID=35525 RepID=A0ABR0AHF6_9CRUS|nr:hypothetical protein OUZ56_009975 [Daphnia magna]